MLKIKVFNYQTGEFQETALTPETGQCIIGRSASYDLVLNSPEVSRVHGKIMFQNGQYYFTDLGSTNGSQINNKEVKAYQSYVLNENDIIRIADNDILIEAIKTPPSGGDATLGERLDTDRRWTKGESNGAAKTDNYASKTALKELPIPPAEPSVATELVPNSSFSTGLPALYAAYTTVGGIGSDSLLIPPNPHRGLREERAEGPPNGNAGHAGGNHTVGTVYAHANSGRVPLIFRRAPKRLITVGQILLLSSLPIGLSSLSGNDRDPQAPLAVSILPVETMPIKLVGAYQVSRIYTGEIAARRISEVGFDRSSQLVLVTVDEGDRVNTGTPLATLDTSNLKAERRKLLAQRAQAVAQLNELQAGPRSEKIAAARASLRQISVEFELARTKHSRRKLLNAEGAISREQLDEVAFEASALKARLDEARSNLEELLAGTRSEQIEAQTGAVRQVDASIASIEIDLAKSTIKAPFAGTISKRLVDEGTVVSAGQSILRLVENGELEARIGVPVSAAANLKPGSKQKLLVGQKTYEARVSSLQPELDSSTRTLSVVLTLDESLAAAVLPGQVARLQLVETIPTSGYWLPTTVLVRRSRGLWSCYVMVKDQKAQENPGSPSPSSLSTPENTFGVERRDVEILHTDGDRVLVRGTLQPGDQVIVNGTHRIVPGQLVRPAQL